MKSITLLLVCVLFITPILAQKKEKNSFNVRLVKEQPHVYVSFEREAQIEPLYQGESGRRIWLRFHNNSKWKVSFCFDMVPKEYGDVGAEYEIERYNGTGVIPETPSSDTCGYTTLKSGKSLLFSVPNEHLAEGLAIKIQYVYEWEFAPDGSSNLDEPKHYVFFYSSELPKK